MQTDSSALKSTCFFNTVLSQKASNLVFAFLISVVISIVIAIGCWQQLNRSLWVDEAMLFSNYPLSSLKALFSPLAYYDQAATPAYSLLASLLSNCDIGTVRAASLMFIALTSSVLLLTGISGWRGAPVALLAITTFSFPLEMLSELKQYGLEIVGVIITILWYLKKNLDSRLDIKDLLILVTGMLLGVSTIVTPAIALWLFFISKFFHDKKLQIRDIIFLAAFGFFAIGYYFLLRHITLYQLTNYPDAYASKGILGNIRAFLTSLFSCASNAGITAIALSLLLLVTNFRNLYARRLIFFSSSILFVFIFISAIGLYPVNNSRHVTWSAAFFWMIVFCGAYLGFIGNRFSKIVSLLLLIILALVSSKNIYYFWCANYEDTENNQAILFIRSLPPSDIGLWIGGQPVVQYYSRLYPDLERHSFFGKVNPLSAKIELQKLSQISDIEYQRINNQPGGWGSMVIFRIIQDYTLPAKVLIREAPRGKEFYIFASHYNINASSGYSLSRVRALHQILENSQCFYNVLKSFRGVTIYKAHCSELK